MKPMKEQWTDIEWATKEALVAGERKVVEAGLEIGHMDLCTHSQDGTNKRKREAVTPYPIETHLQGLLDTRERNFQKTI